MIPVVAVAYHYGPGQDQLQLEQVDELLVRAETFIALGSPDEAEQCYDEALSLLPDGRLHEERSIRLQRNKVKMLIKKLPEAHSDLESLLYDIESDPNGDPDLLSDVRGTLANSQYYITWLMRLEGMPRDEWEPKIEAARQNYRLLAEECEEKGDESALKKNQEDLEASIRLARMDLSDLQALPLPSQ